MSIGGIKRDSEFYFEDAIFCVENTLVRVPYQTVSEHSHKLLKPFADVSPHGASAMAAPDDQPINLDVSVEEFRQLLKVLFAYRASKDVEGKLPRSVEEWTSVLKLSDMWDMNVIRTFAIQRVSGLKMDPVEKARLAIKYKVSEWLKEAVNDLAKRYNPMTEREVEKLGVKVVLKIAEVRERLVAVSSPWPGTNRGVFGHTTATLSVGRRTAGHLDFSTEIECVFGDLSELGFPGPEKKKKKSKKSKHMKQHDE
ncbi:hypothetical protein CONPUDRAFT_82695 [Coniophora puteana RWD-64-598 SS2]|uniref:BTB domain-containing protein n=1 Tax=Coniophora puteana (strain RWD-64-598) TaxID=741705 RepID=A0A5M3MN27_CONPW|nr:uncharacterized protein CONPUDRAFT_82695 [Coniophora puteana RWD-64-598 SS2]EIW80457.1 hypothetical protein CONPUDRAFT_82695 [Coniophora puteana RWD-64-598 SS2]